MADLLYLLPLRYPTEKAYGVTIGNTLSCLPSELFSTEIWCDSKVQKDSYGNTVVPVSLPKFCKSNHFLGARVFGAFIFYLKLLIFAGKTRRKIMKRKRKNIIWTRHPLTLLFVYKSKKTEKILIEFHHLPNFLDRQLTRMYIAAKPLQIIGITENSLQYLKKMFPRTQVFKAEMGVQGETIQDPDFPLPNKLKIGYVGKGTSSGNDNNLKLLIEGFSHIKNLDIQIEFVGLEIERKLELLQMSKLLEIPDDKISFIDHVPHQRISKILAGFSIGIIPYEWNKYNSNRFPIKLVEYAAAGLWILTDSAFADGLNLSEQLVKRYMTGDPQDFADKMRLLCIQISLAPVRNQYAINFARERTYIRRAELIAKELLPSAII